MWKRIIYLGVSQIYIRVCGYLEISKCILPMKSLVLKNVINTSVLYFKIYTSTQHHSRTFMIDKKGVPRKTFQHRLNASFPTFFYFLMSRCLLSSLLPRSCIPMVGLRCE